MRTKEKHRFSKVIAVICVLTLCVTMLTPATYGAGKDVTKIVIQPQEGITYYDEYRDISMAECLSAEDIGYSTNYQYCSDGEGNIEITPMDSASFGRSVIIYAASATKPSIPSSNGATFTVLDERVDGFWKISVSLLKATGEVILAAAASVPEYTVTFPGSTSDYTVLNQTKTYEKGVNVPFSIVLHDSTRKNLSVRVNGTVVEADSVNEDTYSYTIKDLSGDAAVTVAVADKTFSITRPTGTGFIYAANGLETVTYGGTFSFYVSPAAGMDEPKVFIKDTGDDVSTPIQLTSIGNNLYVYSNITADKTIIVEAGEQKSYNVHFDRGAGYNIDIQDTKINHGDDVTFTVTSDNGYKISRVTANNTVINPETNGSYILKNVTADTIVSVAVQREQYQIQYEYNKTSEAYSVIEGKATAEYGDSYTFYVTAKDGYGSPTVKVNGNTVTSIDGRQYVINITGGITISVEAGDKNTQTVTFNAGAGYTFTDTANQKLESLPLSVEYGESIQFKIALDKAYTASTVVVTVNGVNLNSDENGVYTISDIKENKVVSVSGVQKNTYTVTLQQGTGYVLSTTESTRVTADDTFTFSLNINAGYTGTPVVTAGGVNIQPDTDGYYRFTVKGDTTVTVTGVNPAKYAVKINASHATVVAVSEDIHYNGSYQFTVKADQYYQVDQVAVNGIPTTAVNGVYTINNIVDNNNTITVVTSPIKLTVHYVDEKYNTTVSDRIYTIETADRSLTMLTTPDGGIYEFTGWQDGAEAVESISDEMLDKGELTLTAAWKLSEDSITKPINLSTEGSWVTAGNKQQLMFKTFIALVEDLSEEYKANVQITGCGTLFSNAQIEITDAIIQKIKERPDVVFDPNATLPNENLGGNVFNYYANINLQASELQGDETFKLILNVKQQAVRYGLGWVELTVGDKKIIVYCESNAFLEPTTTTTTSN